MAFHITVSGLPENIIIPKLIFGLKNFLKKKANVRRFWINGVSDMRGTNLKSATLEFYNPEDAYNAIKALNGYDYPSDGIKYPLTTQLDELNSTRKSPSPLRYEKSLYEYDRGGYPRSSYRRTRSRSPILHEDPRQFDLELELLRKKRMIIEEERKLLIERKKLELLKECENLGESSLLRDEYDWRDRRRRMSPQRHISSPRRRLMSPSRQVSPPRRSELPRLMSPSRQTAPPRQMSPRRRVTPPRNTLPTRRPPPPRPNHSTAPKKEKPPYNERLPNFYSSCNMILGEMRAVIKTITPKEKNNDMYRILRTLIRKRLTACYGARYLKNNAKEIVLAYRKVHPQHMDEEFVKETLVEVDSEMAAKERDRNTTVAPEMNSMEQPEAESIYQNIDAGIPLYDSGDMNREDYLEGNPGEGGSELSMDGYAYGGNFDNCNEYQGQGGYEHADIKQEIPYMN